MQALNKKNAPVPAPLAFSGNVVEDPVPRLAGPLRAVCRVEAGHVAEAYTGVRMFRDLERAQEGRRPDFAAHLARRVSGQSPGAHGLVACQALERAWGARVPAGARLARNLLLALEMVQAHLTLFFLQDLPGLAGMEPLQPVPPSGPGDLARDFRVHAWEAARKSVAVRRACAEAMAVLAGRWPHPPGVVPGGLGRSLDSAGMEAVAARLEEVRAFVNDVWAPLAYDLAEARRDLFFVGRGPGNFVCAGAMPMNDYATHHQLAPGVLLQGRRQPFLPELVTEHSGRCWLMDERGGRPLEDGATVLDAARPGAYSFVKAARYAGDCCETGPLARAMVGGCKFSVLGVERLEKLLGEKVDRFDVANDAIVSAMGRRLARVEESMRLCAAMEESWLPQMSAGEESWAPPGERPDASASAWSESAEGVVGHAVRLEKGRTASWQILTAGGFNLGPRDQAGRPGVLETALVGCPVDEERGTAVLADIIHSFGPDPAAAAH
jgi:hydrogenase large subunit